MKESLRWIMTARWQAGAGATVAERKGEEIRQRDETSGTQIVAKMPSILLVLAAGVVCLGLVNTTPTIEWMDSINEISCTGKPDGFYADTTSSEESFFRCKNSSIVEQARCEPGYRYDPQSKQCVAMMPLETDCEQTGDGFFTTPGTLCRGYYRCRNGTREDFACPRDSYFDMNSQFCVRTGGICYELVCSGRINGRYPDTTHDCRRSYVCEGGVLRSLISCPAGMLYNGSSCEPLEQVKCSTSEKSAVAVRILPTDPCANLPDGFQTQEDETCRGYLLCHSGQTIAKLRCAPGDYFNGVKCELATNSSCISYCAGKPDGYTTDLRRQCRGYVNCIDGRIAQELSCKDGSVFNGKTCVPALLYQCPLPIKKNICSKLKDGFHVEYMSSCREYFYCHRGQMLVRSTCRDGKVWNGSDCVPSSEFVCEGPEVWPGCNGVENGLYPDLSQSSQCKFYHYCSDGKRVRLSCPNGSVFNGKICVKSSTYACPQLDRDCNNKEDGYYTDCKSGCRSYFFCSDGQKVTYICPDSQVFNGSECVEQHEYNCPTHMTICTNKTNGYHADKESGCHNYAYCLQGIKITAFQCPENAVFDGKKCISSKAHCPKTAQSCDNVDDGLYSEPNSHCTKYFKCVDKKIIKNFTCREGKVFNGLKCVKYICPSKSEQLRRKEDCIGKLGFFQDYESKCNKYYFCINGVKTMLSCKRGQVFNGELCTSDKDYACPIDV